MSCTETSCDRVGLMSTGTAAGGHGVVDITVDNFVDYSSATSYLAPTGKVLSLPLRKHRS